MLPTVSWFVTRQTCAAAAVLLAAGCASLDRTQERHTSLMGPMRVSAPLLLTGDNQEHEQSGLPNALSGGLADALAEVTIRQPFHGLFGRKLLDYVLREAQGAPVLHLGDLLDLSCDSEFERMQRVLLATPSTVLIAPGNHDGLLNGVFNFNERAARLGIGALTWRLRCQSSDLLKRPDRGYPQRQEDQDWRAMMARDEYLRCYLALLEVKASIEPGRYGGGDCKEARQVVPLHYAVAPAGSRAQITDIRGRIVPSVFAPAQQGASRSERFTASWLVQKLHLPAPPGGASVGVIAIDTTHIDRPGDDGFDYMLAALAGRNPGYTGYVGRAQLVAIGELAAQAREDVVVFAGHHHWDSLNAADRAALGLAMARSGRPLIYLSAHTHTGFWKTHETEQGSPLIELNVSSLADWPVAYRIVRFELDETSGAVRVLSPLLPGVVRPQPETSDDHIGLAQAWEQSACRQSGMASAELQPAIDEIVRDHRRGRGGLLDVLSVGFNSFLEFVTKGHYKKNKKASWVRPIYRDSLNDLHFTIRAAATAGTLNPAWANALTASSAELRSACGVEALAPCLAMSLEDRSTESTRDRFDRLFAVQGMLSRAVTALSDHQHVAYMACVAALAAFSEWSQTPGRIGIEPTLTLGDGLAQPQNRYGDTAGVTR